MGHAVFYRLSANSLASSATGNATPSWINAHDMCRHISSLPGMPSASASRISRTAAPTATAACGATRDVDRPRAGGSNSPNPAS
jgi:hypothetical protein